MTSAKKIQMWKSGDCFAIPLLDGQSLLGQVLAAEPDVLNSVSCALFDQKADAGQPTVLPEISRLFSTVMTTRDLLDAGRWKVIGTSKITIPTGLFPFEENRASGFIGAKVLGSRNIEEFANAFCGLSPWDDWADPHYLDRLLISPDVKPATLRFKASAI